ncbi:hypothetical protein H5410_030988 [Solanum commersonii]|uniref:Uncharacterized protein n=1 Tax=Solanum commersonii TaxID=4109 RepID=A0A9J5YH47_SOLCO|nr:hypothetical protein H5410_030988 [Solanum commersonii]
MEPPWVTKRRGKLKAASSVHLDDIPENNPLYAQLQAYLSQKKSNIFSSIAKDDVDDIKSCEKVEKREMIFLLENSEIQSKEEPWKIFQRYLLNGLYFPGESDKTRSYYETLLISTCVEFQHFTGYNTSENVYNFSKMIIKQIISIEDWVIYYNNERHKHTWFIKVCAETFANSIPNWFLNWWSYHGPTIKRLPEPFFKLYREWVKISLDLNNLKHQEHIFYMQQIEQSLYGKELLDLISKTNQDYKSIPHKGIIADTSVRHMARKISNQEEDDQNEMMNNYLEEVKKNLLLNITHYAKSDSSIRSETSNDTHEAQPYESKGQQSNTFSSIAKEDVDDIKSYEKVEKRDIIFFLENSEIQRKEEPWKIFQRYLLNGLYFPRYNTSKNVYNFSKMIIKQIISIEDWVIYYNNERHKHTWCIKVCVKTFVNSIPNWFLNWWSYHGPTIKILPEQFFKLYREWVKVSLDLNNLYHQKHICYIQQIEQTYFFIEFSVPWIHKWAPEVDFTEEQIPCLYRTYFNNFWDKLMKRDPQTKPLFGQELLDLISKTNQDYKSIPHKGIIADTSVRHMVRRISNQDEDDQNKMINNYLEEAKSDSSMRSETSDNTQEAYPCKSEGPVSKDTLKKAEDLLSKFEK